MQRIYSDSEWSSNVMRDLSSPNFAVLTGASAEERTGTMMSMCMAIRDGLALAGAITPSPNRRILYLEPAGHESAEKENELSESANLYSGRPLVNVELSDYGKPGLQRCGDGAAMIKPDVIFIDCLEDVFQRFPDSNQDDLYEGAFEWLEHIALEYDAAVFASAANVTGIDAERRRDSIFAHHGVELGFSTENGRILSLKRREAPELSRLKASSAFTTDFVHAETAGEFSTFGSRSFLNGLIDQLIMLYPEAGPAFL
ncbi:MAG: hypothetical protein JO314_07200 [Acidobacteria bacterium]|nr:hypothetical protein [Acidobacteriota bacterium]